MKIFLKYGILLLCVLGTIFVLYASPAQQNKQISFAEELGVWEDKLNELNYTVIRISAANLINGLNLNKSQIERLLELQKETDALFSPNYFKKNDLWPATDSILETYQRLYEAIVNHKPISDSLKKEILEARLKHSQIINLTLHTKTKTSVPHQGCISCHGMPRHFPKVDANELKNRKIYAFQRQRIDKAHAIGMLGKDCHLKMWYVRDNVDMILNNAQKCMSGEFTCCLLPPSALADPSRAGQAFSTDDWLKFFRDIRQHDNKTWRKYSHLYIKPLEQIIYATLPGITEYHKNQSLRRMKSVLDDIRKMDDIDFELQKDVLINRMLAAYNFDNLTGVASRSNNIKKYVTAMFLLFPGNAPLYEGLLKR